MSNRLIAVLAGASAVTLLAGAAIGQNGPKQAGSGWYTAGQAELAAKLAREPNTNRAKNVILMIADGNGVATNYATRIFYGQQNGGYGDEAVLPKETFPYLALSKTYNTNAQTPDSAGTAVAMNSGVKTKFGVIGVDETLRRGECADVEGATVENIAETLAQEGRSVGVVSTARLTHATPASVYAHVADRNFEDDASLPEGCEVPDIAAQLIDAMASGEIDIALGGGRRHFIPADIEDDEGKTGKREDGRNLVDEATAAGAQYAWDDKTFAALDLDQGTPVLGLFESSHMKYEHDRTGEPSLAEMTAAAIDYLSNNEDGYYLMVEAGRVDHANHDGNAYRSLTDGVAFADAVAKAAELTSQDDTLIIVTADHGHAMAFNGYCGRGSPINGLCYSIDNAGEKHLDDVELAADHMPYTTLNYMNGVGSVLIKQHDGTYAGSRTEIKAQEALDPDYVQQALLPRSSETHSPVDVAIYARGPWAHLVDGTVEQSYIYHVMMHAANAE